MIKSWNAKTEVKYLNRIYQIELTSASMFSKVLGAWANYNGFVSINTVEAHGSRPTMKRVARVEVSFTVENKIGAMLKLYPMDSASRISEIVTRFDLPDKIVEDAIIVWVREHIAILTHESLEEWKEIHA